MSEHGKVVARGKFITTFEADGRIWFEHTRLGEDGGAGSVEVEGKTVVDFDGVAELPEDVVSVLRSEGFDFEDYILPDPDPEPEGLKVCEACEGPAEYLGALGTVTYYRCRNCGFQTGYKK
jgi:hypothetical protein